MSAGWFRLASFSTRAISVNQAHRARIMPRKGAVLAAFQHEILFATNWFTAVKIISKYVMPLIYATKDYKAFMDSVAQAVGFDRKLERIDLSISCELYSGMDSDAPVKGIFDGITQSGVIDDDSCIRNFRVIRGYHKRGRTSDMVIEAREVGPDQPELIQEDR